MSDAVLAAIVAAVGAAIPATYAAVMAIKEFREHAKRDDEVQTQILEHLLEAQKRKKKP